MIVSCPQCNRRYRMNNEYLDKYIRCVCSAVLKVSETRETKPIENLPESNDNSTLKPPTIDSLIFPDLVNLINLDQFETSDKFDAEAVDELPEIELPSFDEDEFEDTEESDDSSARKSSLSNLEIEAPKILNPKIPSLLSSLNKSQDPKFIINALYYLLEVKHFSIEDTVKKFVDNPNPLAAYFAKRILQDLEKMRGNDHRKPERLEAFPRETIFNSLFKGSEQTKIEALDKIINGLQYGAIPYFICQLLLEKNPNVIKSFLTRMGLLSNDLEIQFFAQFLQHKNQQVRFAAIEGLGGIGGLNVIAHLIPSLIDSNSNIVSAVKVALGTSDQDEIAQQIRVYVRKNQVQNLEGYLEILKGFQSAEGFRGIVQMFDRESIRQNAFEVAKEYDISEDDKTAILEEYLTLSFDDGVFTNEVIEYLELINSSYDRARLIPINVFDDSYVELVRMSPLFQRDFQKDEEGEASEKEEAAIPVPIFRISEVVKKPLDRAKNEIEKLQHFAKSKLGLPIVTTQFILYSSLGFLCFLAWTKGMGTNSKGLPTTFLPSRFETSIGSLIFEDPSFTSAINTAIGVSFIVLFFAWFLGSFLAIAQLKNGIKGLRFLPMFPLLISPLIIGYTLGSTENAFPGIFSIELLLSIGFVFPCLGIYYLVFTRMFQVVPESQVEIAKQLGAKEDVAHATVYGPFYLIGSIFSSLLALLYIFSAHAIGFFIKSNKAIGYLILKKLEFPEGYIMMGAYALPLVICSLLLVLIIESFFPIACFFPMGVARPTKHPVYATFEEWMALLGSVFYSISCYKKPKGQVTIVEIVDSPVLAEQTEVIDSKTPEAKPEVKPEVKVSTEIPVDDEDDFDDFDD